MKKSGIIIRADASLEMGSGHVMRCIALAQAAEKAQFHTTFIISAEAEFIKSRLTTEQFDVVVSKAEKGTSDDADCVISYAKEKNVNWVITDGYHFDHTYQQQLKAAGLKILFVDDYGHCEDYTADYILNQNIYADAKLYPSKKEHTKLLIGPKYCLLRSEFYPYFKYKKPISPNVKNVLLTFGGTDPAEKTIPALKLVNSLAPDLEKITVLAGIGNKRLQDIEQLATDLGPHVHILKNAGNVPDLLAETDLAISAAGSTVWELLFMGVPSIVISVADNQDPIADYIQQNKLGLSLERNSNFDDPNSFETVKTLLEDQQLRSMFSENGQQTVDGKGAIRVASCFDELSFIPATMDDCKWIWELANEPQIRNVSFASEPIPWDVHVNWYSNKIKQSDCIYWVALNAFEEKIGQVRFEIENDEATMSISLKEQFRGRGYGTRIIVESGKTFFNEHNHIKLINAFIKPDNTASIDAFKKAGYIKDKAKSIPEKLLFVLKNK